jgi:hypothetical protein
VKKRVLVVSWSQSGQLGRVRDAFVAPFAEAGHDVVRVELTPVTPYPFPWKVTSFFGEFPETVLGRPKPIAPVEIPPGDWDLVVLAAQVWFLSPSQPVAAFLASPAAEVLRGRRVLTLVSCRNMWLTGWRKLVTAIQARGGVVTDRVVATQSGPEFASFFTTLAFMLTGRRDAIKALPAATVADETFARLADHGRVAAARLATADARAPVLHDRVTAGLSHAHAFGEWMVRPLYPVIATATAALSAPGTALRGVFAVGILAFTLTMIFGLVIPCVVTEKVLRRWIAPWLDGLARLPVRDNAQAPSHA